MGTTSNTSRCRTGMVEAFAMQIGWCERLASPFTAKLLRLLARDLAEGGAVARLTADWTGDPVADAVPLRLAGALHALVLDGKAPALGACYPPPAAADPTCALRATLGEHEAGIRSFMASPPQTNEVARSGVLLGGFLTVAAAWGLPLRLLELGASAGLNLIWDRYSYRLGDSVWGDPRSEVVLEPDWRGALPPIAAKLAVCQRAGCDVAPIDLEDDAQRLRLSAYVWADQRDRLARLEAAIRMARAEGVQVERADAGVWVATRLASRMLGTATVVYHSIMWQYVAPAAQAAITDAIAGAGARADASAPLSWLRFEPAALDRPPELRLTQWPGGEENVLATAHPHVSTITWLVDG